MNFNTFTLTQTLNLLKKRELSIEDLYLDILKIIQERNQELNIFLSFDKTILNKAKLQRDKTLMGVPLAVKDNFLTVDFKTTASSKVLNNFIPPYESTVTARLKAHGGIIIGKTNMDAWAHGSSTETSDFDTTKNPRNPKHLPGGSSGGSAAAVAADMCIAAIGSETAGSIRQPSAWCGCVGFKPTYGRVSRYGLIAMGSSLDSPGPITKTVEDAAFLLNIIAGKDKYDATSKDTKVLDFTRKIKQGIKGMKIGICYLDHPKLKNSITKKAILEAGKIFEKLGANVETVKLAESLNEKTILTPDYAIGVYTVIQRSEVSSNLARYDGIRYGNDRSFFGAEAKRRIILGTFTLSKGYAEKYYLKASQVRNLYIKNFQNLFARYDILISPTSPGFALKLGASANSPMFGELEDMLLEPSSISGLPGINVPCYHDFKTNLYLGMNIIADHWQEEKILQAAYAYEQNTPWNSWLK